MHIVAIDAGHGMPDPGAIGSYWTDNNEGMFTVYEMDVTFNIANLVHENIITRNLPIQPVLIRQTEDNVSLQNRCILANNILIGDTPRPADLFVSIHHNARPMTGKFGIELENWHYPGSANGKKLSEVILKTTLTRLKQDDINMPVFDRGVKEKGFYVLKHTRMPATLLELGFLSDPEEAKFLHQSGTQKILAECIVDGLMAYIDPQHYATG